MKFLRNTDKEGDAEKRTSVLQKNIFYSFFVKGFGILVSLLLVPITIKFLNATEYGIWLTLNSVLLWINTFDIGLGNGLRNKLTEAIANDDWARARSYVSTSYVVVSLLVLIIFCIFFIINNLINWYVVLNVSPALVPNLKSIILMAFSFFCISFVLKLIGNVLLALQKSAVENLLIMLGQFLALILIYLISIYQKGTLWDVAFIYSISPVIVYAISYPFVFKGQYKQIRPSIAYYKAKYVKDIMSLGTQFFVLQIAALVIFSTSNLIISNMFGPDMVTKYNVAFRYFNVIPMLFTIVLTPIWSATTEAYANREYTWILESMKKVKLMLFGTTLVVVLMLFLSDWVYSVWVGKDILVPFSLSMAIAIYIVILVASLSYSSFLNGLGKLRVQMINILVSSILFLPITFVLGNIFGITGVVISLTLVNLSGLVLNIIQFNLVLSDKAKGVWSK